MSFVVTLDISLLIGIKDAATLYSVSANESSSKGDKIPSPSL